MAFEGANPDQLDQLAAQFNGTAQRLEDIRQDVTRRLGYSSWKGPAADRFRHQWTSSSHAIDATASALRQAQKLLNDNANQQRGASGEATKNDSGGGLFGKLLHDAEKVVGAEAKAVHDVLHAVVHGAEAVVGAEATFVKDAWNAEVRGFEDLGKTISKDWDDFVKSPAFDDILEVAKVVSAVAPIIAVICPVIAPAMLAIAAVGAVVVLAGDAIKMANTGKWNVGELALDGAGVALSMVGAGAFGSAAKAAGEAADGANLLSKGGVASVQTLSTGAKAMVVLKTTNAAMEVGANSGKAVTDLQNQNYGGAVLDGVGAATSVIGLHGNGGEGAELGEKLLPAEADSVGADADVTHDLFYDNEKEGGR